MQTAKRGIERIGVPNCNNIRCPKLDPVIQAIVPNEAIKADRYLSHLQQFWLDATALLTAIIEIVKEGKLTPDMAVSAAQMALFLMGNTHQHMAQERRKRILINLNPPIKSMASDEKVFRKAAPMLFGDEFAKLATERVDQLKAISKFSKPAEQKKNRFLDPIPKIPPRVAAGVETEAAEVSFSHTRGPAALDQTKTTKDRNSRKFFSCKLYTYANRDSYRVTPYCVQEKYAECDLALNKEGYSCYSVCGVDQAFLTKLAPDNARPLGSTSGTGVLASINTNPNSKNLAFRGSLAFDQRKLITKEIEELKRKGVISPACQAPGAFVSQLYLVPKKDSGQRPVINLRALNRYIQVDHFKMEGFHMVKELVRPQDWVMKVDLKDAYFLVPIHPDHHKYL